MFWYDFITLHKRKMHFYENLHIRIINYFLANDFFDKIEKKKKQQQQTNKTQQ